MIGGNIYKFNSLLYGPIWYISLRKTCVQKRSVSYKETGEWLNEITCLTSIAGRIIGWKTDKTAIKEALTEKIM